MKNYMKMKLQEWLPKEVEINDEMLMNVIYTPIPILKDVQFLKEEKPIKLGNEGFSWKEYIDRLVEWKPGKDPKLKIIHKAKLLRIPEMKYNTHSIEITPSGVGKTLFYYCAGHVIDKASPKSVVGFAKNPEEVFYGTAHNSELPIALDQIESQTAHELARYMFNLLELGVATVDSGATRFEVYTKSSFAFLGNPDIRKKKGLDWLFIHISYNTAFGRRFAIILFETSRERMKPVENKLTPKEEEEWKASFSILRAIEEYCYPKLKQIWRDIKINSWLQRPIDGYEETISKIAENTQDEKLKDFMLNHTKAQHRVRASALNIALVELLDKIALDSITIDEIIELAEEYLPEIVNINIDSFKVMSDTWSLLEEESLNAWYGSLPEYAKHIVNAIILYIKAHPEKSTFSLKEIPYKHDKLEYFSKAIDKLRSLKRGLKHFDPLLPYGITIKQENGDFIVVHSSDKIPPIKTEGKLLSQNETLEKISETPLSEKLGKSGNWGNSGNDQNKVCSNCKYFNKDASFCLLTNTLTISTSICDNWTLRETKQEEAKSQEDKKEQKSQDSSFTCKDCKHHDASNNKCLKHPEWAFVSPFHLICGLFEKRDDMK
jgi:hypothetical protein